MKTKPWSMNVGMAVGLVVGGVLWLGSYDRNHGPFQNLGLVVFPVAMSAVIVSIRNRRKKVGPYDPELIAENKKGRS